MPADDDTVNTYVLDSTSDSLQVDEDQGGRDSRRCQCARTGDGSPGPGPLEALSRGLVRLYGSAAGRAVRADGHAGGRRAGYLAAVLCRHFRRAAPRPTWATCPMSCRVSAPCSASAAPTPSTTSPSPLPTRPGRPSAGDLNGVRNILTAYETHFATQGPHQLRNDPRACECPKLARFISLRRAVRIWANVSIWAIPTLYAIEKVGNPHFKYAAANCSFAVSKIASHRASAPHSTRSDNSRTPAG